MFLNFKKRWEGQRIESNEEVITEKNAFLEPYEILLHEEITKLEKGWTKWVNKFVQYMGH